MSSRLPGQRYWGLVYRCRAYFFCRGSRRVFPIRSRPMQDAASVFPCTRGGGWGVDESRWRLASSTDSLFLSSSPTSVLCGQDRYDLGRVSIPRIGAMQDPAYEVPRTTLLRGWVNKPKYRICGMR